jgi:hypothetical protein
MVVWPFPFSARARLPEPTTLDRIERAPIPLKEPAPKKPPPQHHAAAATPALLAVRQDPQNGDKLMNCETEASLVSSPASANSAVRDCKIKYLQRHAPPIVKRR